MTTDSKSCSSGCASGKPTRRGFLGAAGIGLAGVLLAPGVRLIEIAQAAGTTAPSAGASSKVRWGMLIDSTKCNSGCTDCVSACNNENGLSGAKRSTDSQWIRKIEIKAVNSAKTMSLPLSAIKKPIG